MTCRVGSLISYASLNDKMGLRFEPALDCQAVQHKYKKDRQPDVRRRRRPRQLPIRSYGLCLAKRHSTAESCRWSRNFCAPGLLLQQTGAGGFYDFMHYAGKANQQLFCAKILAHGARVLVPIDQRVLGEFIVCGGLGELIGWRACVRSAQKHTGHRILFRSTS
jgi:hypothetical protein